MTVLLRPAVAEDLEEVARLHYRSRLAAYRSFVPIAELTAEPPEALARWWTERGPRERHTHVMMRAERDGRLVGFTYVGPYQAPGPGPSNPDDSNPDDGRRVSVDQTGLGELYAIHLDPTEWGRDTGRALMIDALATLYWAGWRRAGLWVYADNARARHFYERGGWALGGAERNGRIGSCVVRQLYYHRPLP